MANGPVGNVLAFHIGPDNSLTTVPGSPFPAGQNSASVAVDPLGRFAYVTNFGQERPGQIASPPRSWPTASALMDP
jgi:DNA-binding beta-propeller fold protein YncE